MMKNTAVKNNKGNKMSGWLEKWEQTNYRNMKIASISVFILLAIYMTVIHNFNYLKKVEDLSLFLPSWTFLKECMMLPGSARPKRASA